MIQRIFWTGAKTPLLLLAGLALASLTAWLAVAVGAGWVTEVQLAIVAGLLVVAPVVWLVVELRNHNRRSVRLIELRRVETVSFRLAQRPLLPAGEERLLLPAHCDRGQC